MPAPPAPVRDSHSLRCQSARTAFDLLLQALAFPPGTQVLITAVTIPDMVAIMRSDGLVPIPVDLEPECLSSCIDSLKRGLQPTTRMLVVPHLFGGRFDMAPLVDFAQQHGLMLVEDRAQSFAGADECEAGDADLALYSFGPIKICTALGGGLAVAQDSGLLSKMERIQHSYQTQGRVYYLKRIVKYGLLKALSARLPYTLLNQVCRWCRIDHDHLISCSARTFRGTDLVTAIRKRPSAVDGPGREGQPSAAASGRGSTRAWQSFDPPYPLALSSRGVSAEGADRSPVGGRLRRHTR